MQTSTLATSISVMVKSLTLCAVWNRLKSVQGKSKTSSVRASVFTVLERYYNNCTSSDRIFWYFVNTLKSKYIFMAFMIQVQLSLGDFVAARRSLKKALVLGSQQPLDRQAVKKVFKYGKKNFFFLQSR